MIFTKIKNWLSRIFSKPALADATDHTHTSSTGTQEPQFDEYESYEAYTNKLAGLDDIVTGLGVHKRISASHKYMYDIGKRDGGKGVRPDILAIARCTAHTMFQRIFITIKGRLGALDAQLESEKNVMEVEERLYKHEQAYSDYVTYQYRFFPRNYSFLLAGIYFIVALALIIADLPLALKLIQKGFDLEGPGFGDLFKQGHFWNTVAANWETAITALGIALCTVYIKIFYDEYVGTPYASKLMSFRKFLEENGLRDEEEIITQKISKESKQKFLVKLTLVVVTIVCILILALFRNETNAADQGGGKFFEMLAFIAITVLFPVIGGVCLSYALNNFQNRLRLWFAKRKCAKRLGILRDKVKQYTLTKSNYEDLAAAAARLGDENKMVEEYKDYLAAFYERGYAIGAMNPDKLVKGEEFFNKVIQWRNVIVTRAINHSINKLN